MPDDIKTAPVADKKAKEAHMQKQEAMQNEEDAERAKAKLPGAVPIGFQPVPSEKEPKLVMRATKRLEEDHTHYSVVIEGVPANIDAIKEFITKSPRTLWPLHDKRLQRYDVLTVRDDLWRWEYTTRVMKIDKELQVIMTSIMSAPVLHSVTGVAIDYDNVKVVHRGAKGKFSLMYRDSVLIDGFETEEEAHKWLVRKRAA